MTALQAYLNRSETQKVLSRKPGEEGFSLIELVVVVAVLAILAAIAIPSFTAIQDNAAQAAAKNTIATVAKECAVKRANMETLTFTVPTINSYLITPTGDSNCNGVAHGGSAGWLVGTRTATAPTTIPSIIKYNVTSGAKVCLSGTNTAFCSGATETGGDGSW